MISMNALVHEYDEVFTVSDFARIFKLSDSAVRSMIRQKKINAVKIGGRYRIPKRIVDRFFAQAELRYEDVLDECYGMWEERTDIKDGVEYVREARSK